MVKLPTREEAECILKIVEKEMGLSLGSCFRINLEKVEFGPPWEVTPGFVTQYGIQRRGQGCEKLWYINRGSATLVVAEEYTCSLDKKAIEAAMGALALAVRLSCFGRGGRRGLGCFSIRAHGRYRELFEEEPKALIRRAADAAGAVVDRSRCRGLPRGETSPCGLPPVPALSAAHRYDACVKNLIPYMLISVKNMRQEDLYSFWQRTRCYDYINEKEALKTWIIGSVSGRPSPLMLKISGNTAYLNAFASADWPREMKIGWQKIQIRETDISTTMVHILTEFVNYVEKRGGEATVWPKSGREI